MKVFVLLSAMAVMAVCEPPVHVYLNVPRNVQQRPNPQRPRTYIPIQQQPLRSTQPRKPQQSNFDESPVVYGTPARQTQQQFQKSLPQQSFNFESQQQFQKSVPQQQQQSYEPQQFQKSVPQQQQQSYEPQQFQKSLPQQQQQQQPQLSLQGLEDEFWAALNSAEAVNSQSQKTTTPTPTLPEQSFENELEFLQNYQANFNTESQAQEQQAPADTYQPPQSTQQQPIPIYGPPKQTQTNKPPVQTASRNSFQGFQIAQAPPKVSSSFSLSQGTKQNSYPTLEKNEIDDNIGPVGYSFEYMIEDAKSGNNFGHREFKQGQSAQGAYYAVLPDGRRQTVEYEADKNGYRPKITYQDGFQATGVSKGQEIPQSQWVQTTGFGNQFSQQSSKTNQASANNGGGYSY